MIYGGTAASALGSLLRKAQEDRQQGPHLIPQSAQEESPIRQQIQGPLAAPESVGSEKVVSMKGEMQPIQEGSTMAPGVAGIDNPTVVPPIVAPVSESMTPGGSSVGASPMNIASSIGSSGIGSTLLPSSMKPGTNSGSILAKSIPIAPAITPKNVDLRSGGTITQGNRIESPTEKAGTLGSVARGALSIGKSLLNLRPSLSLPMFMSGDILKKAVNSLMNPGRGKTTKG